MISGDLCHLKLLFRPYFVTFGEFWLRLMFEVSPELLVVLVWCFYGLVEGSVKFQGVLRVKLEDSCNNSDRKWHCSGRNCTGIQAARSQANSEWNSRNSGRNLPIPVGTTSIPSGTKQCKNQDFPESFPGAIPSEFRSEFTNSARNVQNSDRNWAVKNSAIFQRLFRVPFRVHSGRND